MKAKLNEKDLQKLIMGIVLDVIDPVKNFNKRDCERANVIGIEVVKSLKRVELSEEQEL